MREHEAAQRAAKLSRERNELMFVIYEPEYCESPRNCFWVCNEYDLETFYLGAVPRAAYEGGRMVE